MRGRRQRAEELATRRNLAAGVVAVVAATGGVAGAAGAPTEVKVALGLLVVAGAVVVLALHVMEGRAGPELVSPSRPVPRYLPIPPMRFVNREAELAQLDTLMEQAQSAPGSLVAVLSGVPAVGKSALGSHWTNHMRRRFRDGDLFGDFSKRRHGTPVEVSDVLRGFLHDLGTADVAIPPKLSDRADLFRNLTADRQLLILLDDVTQAAQVQPLRPSGAGSVVIVTSYSRLEELLYGGAELVHVEPLPDARARDLVISMARHAGWRFEEEREATDRLVSLCGGLPLPLCVCAGRLLASDGARSVSSMVSEIIGADNRLQGLSGKLETSLPAVFDFAYADLGPGDALVYRRLGLHPGHDLAVPHAALLADLSLAAARDRLEALANTHLLEPMSDGRYRFHDLLRLHARDCAERDDSESRDQLLWRLVGWYHGGLRNADRTIVPERLRLAENEDVRAAEVPSFDSRTAAFEWLEAERANVTAVLRAAHDHEWDERVWQMVEALWPFHHNHRHYADWIDSSEMGIASARRCGNHEAAARLRVQLARAYIDLGGYDRARDELRRAEDAVRSSSNMRLRASVRECVGISYLGENEYAEALVAFRESRAMFESFGGTRGMAIQDYFIGRALTGHGKYEEALEVLERALSCMRAIDDQLFIGRILLRRGQAEREHGCLEQAEATLRDGIEILGPLGMRLEEAESYEALAAIADSRAENEEAAAYRHDAYRIYRAIGHPRAGELAATRGASPALGQGD